MRRRDFIRTSALAGAALGLGATASLTRATPNHSGKAAKPKNILVMGGTGFLGPHIVNRLIERGHTVTLFNRGKTNTHLFPDLRKLRGDRQEGDLMALEGESFDAVIDTNAYFKRAVYQALETLGDRIDQYVVISTISVYPTFPKIGLNENDPIEYPDDESIEDITGSTYGVLKALCERTAEEMLPGRVTTIRPGLIVGPRDNTDRWTYWPVRIQRGGRVLAPGDGNASVQFIDARDLANFIVHTTEEKITGVFNATGPANKLTFGRMLRSMHAEIGGDTQIEWVDQEFFAQHGVSAWQNLPMFIPAEGDFLGFAEIDCSKAITSGLAFRSVAESTRDTLAWWNELPEERRAAPKWPWLAPDKEAEVLEAWDNRDDSGAHDHPH